MTARIALNMAELSEAVLVYLDDRSETIKVSEYAGVSMTWRIVEGVLVGVEIVVDEKLTTGENS